MTSRASTLLLVAGLMAGGLPPVAHARPRSAPSPEQKRADRHFRNGVALYEEDKFAEALAEFERAYQIAPHPTVLYNIATSLHRLSRYREAIAAFQRFLAEGAGVVPEARLAAAREELDAILGRVARVTIKVEPSDATVTVDGAEVEADEMPLILPPGEHRVSVTAPGRRPGGRVVQVASGDEAAVTLVLEPEETREVGIQVVAPPPSPASPSDRPRRFAVSGGFGTNLRQAADTGAPSLGLGVVLGARVELGLDALMVAYAAVPSVRLRLVGTTLALHAVAAVPIAFTDGDASEPFVAGAGGLGLRWRATDALALRLEGWVAYAGSEHGTTVPALIGGEVWF